MLSSRALPNKGLYINFSESGSQVTHPGTLYLPIFLHSPPLPLPFSLLPPPFSYSFYPLPSLTFLPSLRLLSFYFILFSLLRPTFSAFLVHGPSRLLQNGIFSSSVTVTVAYAVGIPPTCPLLADVPIMQLAWMLVNNSSHVHPSAEHCP